MRQRAAVLIGVSKTGGLQRLQAVDDGVQAVARWMAAQPGFRDEEPVELTVGGRDETLESRIVTLTDKNAPVTAADIRRWIRAFVDLATVEQLFVYFSGHGVNVRFSEYWLLSGAPDDPNEAVNVRGSADLARYCGIPHVVFISDACRTPAANIQAQTVEGSLVFPNTGVDAPPGCVDVFYASMVGKPALEVRDARDFQAVYTEALIEALSGSHSPLVEQEAAQDPPVGRVRPWPLQRYLRNAVPKLLADRGVPGTVTQTPDAIITSEPEEWLAEVEVPQAPRRRRSVRGVRDALEVTVDDEKQRPTLADVGQDAVRSALSGTRPATRSTRRRGRVDTAGATDATPEGSLFRDAHDLIAATPAPGHFESQCGFRVSGTAVHEALSAGARVAVLDGAEGIVRVEAVHGPAANVLVVFADGRGALVPALPGFIGALTYDSAAGELASVEYEPSDNTPLYADLEARLPELRQLRRVVAAAASLGVFRLDGRDDREALMERMRELKGVDPSMAVYASYALHDMQRRDDIVDVEQHLRDALRGPSLFDVAMLARGRAAPAPLPDHVFPAVPLLSQGWALLDAYQVQLPARLLERGIRRHATGSLWTLFDEQGVALLRAAITSEEIR